MRRKRPSRRRIKRRFLHGRLILMSDVYDRDLIDWIKRYEYRLEGPYSIRRCFIIILDEISEANLRAAMFGDSADQIIKDDPHG